MTTDVHIRPIAQADNEALAALIRAVFEEYDVPRQGTVFSDPTTDILYETFQQGGRLYVAEEGGTLLGSCGIYPTEGLEVDTCELVKFYLSPQARGKGVGKQLLFKSIEEAVAQGYRKMYLESFPHFGTAVGLYRKLGFRALEGPLGNSGHHSCTIWMIKDLV